MSISLPAEQVEHAFNPKRLGNWEQPRSESKVLQHTTGGSRFGTLQARSGACTTRFIVDDRGYLMPGVPKLKNAFLARTPDLLKSPARWPQENVAIKTAARSTMGYKGIMTDYLPTSTVSIKTADIPGTREFNYSFR